MFIYLPFFSSSIYQAPVLENVDVNTTVITVSILNTFLDAFSYSLISNYSESFAIDSEGVVITSVMLDYESINSYNITISATSANFHLVSLLVITIVDVNDNPPIFSQDSYVFVLPAYTPLGTVLDIVNVTDEDSPPNAVLQYSLQSSSSPSQSQYFNVDNNGGLEIVYSLLNSLDEYLAITVLVNDSVHEASALVTIQLIQIDLRFPVTPSFMATTNMNTYSVGGATVTEDLMSSAVQVSQMFAFLPSMSRGDVSLNLGDRVSTSLSLITPLKSPAHLLIELLRYDDETVHSYQNDLTFVAQIWDFDYSVQTTQEQVVINFTHSDGTTVESSSCITDSTYGRCLIYITIPYNWFQSSSSIVNWTASVVNQPHVKSESSSLELGGVANRLSYQANNNSIVALLPAGKFLPEELIDVDVYAITRNAIAGFSILLNIDTDLELNNLSFNKSHWSIGIESDGQKQGIIGLLSSPSTQSSYTGDYTHLLTLHLQVSQELSVNKECFITGSIISLSDVVEGPVIVDNDLGSRMGPVFFMNESGTSENGSISAITDHIVTVLPYVSQPVLFNTAVLSGTQVEIPVELWVGYSSGGLSLYNGIIETCDTSDSDTLIVSSDCRSLILTGFQQGSGIVNITMGLSSGIIGFFIVTVYQPVLPMAVNASDTMLEPIRLSLNENCEYNHQKASLKVFADFATNDSMIREVDITDLVRQFTISSNTTAITVDSSVGILATGVNAGTSSICVNTFHGTNPSCVNMTAEDNSVFVVGLTVAIHQGVENIVLEETQEEFVYNVSMELDSRVQNISRVIVSLQYLDNTTELIQPEELDFQVSDSDILTVSNEGELVAHRNGKTNLSIVWVGPGSGCELELTKMVPLEVVLLTPTQIVVTPNPANTHQLTGINDPSAVLGIKTSYTIEVLLEYSGGIIVEPTEPLIYELSNNSLATLNENIIQGSSGAGLVELMIMIPYLQTTVILQFNVVSTVSALVTAVPFPAFTGSQTIDVSQIAPIEGTLYWQQSQLELKVLLTDGYMIEATEHIDGEIFTVTSGSSTITATTESNILSVYPLNGMESSGILTITPVLTQFSDIHRTITVIDTPMPLSNATINTLPNTTISGVYRQNNTLQRINLSVQLQDNSLIHDILSVSNEFVKIVSFNVMTSDNFLVSPDGYLIPLANSHDIELLVVTVAGKFEREITLFVNLQPSDGDIDAGSAVGPPLEAVVTGDQLLVPLFINTGSNSSLAHIQLTLQYDRSVFDTSGTVLGEDWNNGIFHFDVNTEEDSSVLFTSIFPERTMNGDRLHLCTVILTALLPVAETEINIEILVIGYHDEDSSMTSIISTPYESVAGNTFVSISGNVKRDVTTLTNTKASSRSKRESANIGSGCTVPPCDCQQVNGGDINSDCQFDSGDVLQLLNFLKLDFLDSSLMLENSSNLETNDYDITLDQAIDVHDMYVMFKALIGYIPLIRDVSITPVQSPLSRCQFTVKVSLSENTVDNVGSPIVYLVISVGNSEQLDAFQSTVIEEGQLITHHQNGGLIQAVRKPNTLNEYEIALNTSIVGDVGVSVVLQSLDSSNQTTHTRTVQYLGQPPLIYTSQLTIDSESVYVFTSNGYSPLIVSSNEIESRECSELPLISEFVDILFTSPYNATVVWELENLRRGLSLASLIFVSVTECKLDQNKERILSSCRHIGELPANTNTSLFLETKPFRSYTVRVFSVTSSSNETTEISPEDIPTDLDAPVDTILASGETLFQWDQPNEPNGVILSYSFYINDKLQYNGSSLSYQVTITVQESFTFYVEAFNSAGSVRSPIEENVPTTVIVEGINPLGPLTFSQFIGIIIGILLLLLVLILLLFVVPGAFTKRRRSNIANNKEDLTSFFYAEIDRVEEKPHSENDHYNLSEVLAVPQGRIYEEQFSTEYEGTFWYSELSSMEFSPSMAFTQPSMAASVVNEQPDETLPMSEANENWDLHHGDNDEITVEAGEPDISDLYTSDTIPLTTAALDNTLDSNDDKKKKKHKKKKKTKEEKERDLLPAGRPDILSDRDCKAVMDKLKEFQIIGSSMDHGQPAQNVSTSDRYKDYFFGAFDTVDPRKKTHVEVERTTHTYQPTRIHSSIGAALEESTDGDWPQSDEAVFDAIARLSAISNFEYLNEFNRLKAIRPKGSTTHAKLACNQQKNRYRNVLPNDDTRVCLQNVPGHIEGADYVNANLITVHPCCPQYVATQGPLPATVNDFWQMVWETETTCIAMVTNTEENGRTKCETYWAEEGIKIYRDTATECLEKSFQKAYRTRTFRIASRGITEQRRLKHIHYTNWPDFGVPQETQSFLEYVDEFKNETGTILVHCSAGLGRTGVFIAVDAALRLHRAGLAIDVPKIVGKIRQQRDGMIQTHEQYQFVYKAIAQGLQTQIHGSSSQQRT